GIDVQNLSSNEKTISRISAITKVMQIIIGSTSQWLIEVQLAGWPIVIIPKRTFELSFQAFLSQVMNKNVQTSGSSG
ncbi:hypothetical protein ACTQ3Y_14785, partial [Segatella copri]|uniref:hypothetical protein n=1 Tax=Segatella copri TaxID=165179 RepID=UPI003F9DAD83